MEEVNPNQSPDIKVFFSHINYTRVLSILGVLVIIAAIPLTVFLSQQQQELRGVALGAICSSNTNQACSYTNNCTQYPNGTLCEVGVNGCGNPSSGNNVYKCVSGKWVYEYWTQSGSCKFCGPLPPSPVPSKTLTPTPHISPSSTPAPTKTNTPIPTKNVSPTPTPLPTAIPTVPPTVTPIPGVSPTPTPPLTTFPTATIPPTLTPIPTPTVIPGDTQLSIDTCPHGLGDCGDNVNPHGGNKNPHNTQKVLTVLLYNSINQLVASASGLITYATNTQRFSGTVDVGPLSTGVYIVRIQVPQYLIAAVPGIQQITGGTINPLPITTLVTGDINGDNKIDIQDYNILISCYNQTAPTPNCSQQQLQLADLDDDGFVDLLDYNQFVRELSTQQGQ